MDPSVRTNRINSIRRYLTRFFWLAGGMTLLYWGFSSIQSGEARYRTNVLHSVSPIEFWVVVVLEIIIGFSAICIAFGDFPNHKSKDT